MAYVCIIYMELMFQWGGGTKKEMKMRLYCYECFMSSVH